jgi:hypothetical protein
VPSSSSVLAPPSLTQQTVTAVPSLVPSTSSIRVTTSASSAPTSGGSTTTPNGSTNGAALTSSHSLVVYAAFVVALLPFLG